MLRQADTNRGFTIIEVVITIAIGAAVMALVLNAVAGARRSQRNNARQADVSQLVGVINQYVATRNALPATAGDIKTIADDFTKLGHYTESQINVAKSWTSTIPHPSTDGHFSEVQLIGGVSVDHTCPEIGDSGACDTTLSTFPAGALLKAGTNCVVGDGNTTCTYVVATGNTPAKPDATGLMGDGDKSNDADHLVIFRRASCDAAGSGIVAGGIREMAIAYIIEGQDAVFCLEV